MLNEFRLALRTLLKAPYFHSVAERTQETGIGMALGAERRDVLELFLRLRLLCCVGIVAGSVASLLFATYIPARRSLAPGSPLARFLLTFSNLSHSLCI
jgi:ABC-type antimicrobial peptide transport system permease subunit